MTLTGALWFPFDVQFGSLFGPLSRYFYEHVDPAQNAPHAHENASLEVPGSQIPSLLGTSFDTILEPVSEPSPGLPFGAIYVAMVLQRRVLGPLCVPMASKWFPKGHPRGSKMLL